MSVCATRIPIWLDMLLGFKPKQIGHGSGFQIGRLYYIWRLKINYSIRFQLVQGCRHTQKHHGRSALTLSLFGVLSDSLESTGIGWKMERLRNWGTLGNSKKLSHLEVNFADVFFWIFECMEPLINSSDLDFIVVFAIVSETFAELES